MATPQNRGIAPPGCDQVLVDDETLLRVDDDTFDYAIDEVIPASQTLSENTWIDTYRIIRVVHQGRDTTVYMALDSLRRLGPVALKIGRHPVSKNSSHLARLQQESELLRRLKHQNIVRHQGEGIWGEHWYCTMEFVPGMDLERLIRRTGPQSPIQAANYVSQVANGLAYAHQCGVIHRDVKPSNLVLSHNGVVKILDFGLARVCDKTASITRLYGDNLLGTADFMAPEQTLDCHEVDGRADVYSLGCTLYFLLAGRVPFGGLTLTEKLLAHQNDAPPPLTSLGVPPQLSRICRRMMAKWPADRFSSVQEVRDCLVEFLIKCRCGRTR